MAVMKENSSEWFLILVGSACAALTGASLPVYSWVFGDIVGVGVNILRIYGI